MLPSLGLYTENLKAVVAAAISGSLIIVLFRRDLPALLEKMRDRR